jgi:DNA polymerase-3 subunit alpha/error-prone DNA polymerase
METRLALTTSYSLLWGTMQPGLLFDQLKQWNVGKVAITDRDNLYGYPACREEAQRCNIELICAACLTEGDDAIFAFVQNQKGYEQLCLLLTKRAQDSAFSYLPSLLAQSEGLVLSTTSPTLLTTLAKSKAELYGAVTPTCLSAVQTARRLGIALLACDDALMQNKQDEEVHRILRCMALHKTVGSLEHHDCSPPGKVLLEPDQWTQAFSCWPDAVDNANKLKAYDPFPSSLIFPDYPVDDAAKELEIRVLAGAEVRYGEVNDAILERITYELGIIKDKGFAPYFLVMHDIVQMSSRTCGRGSGAASIVSYCLFITNVDPIAHHLYFERFLSPSRLDPPDIDVDFAWDERDGVFAAVFERFGREHCARVANHNCFRLRGAVRETGRCYGLSDTQISEAEKKLFISGLRDIDDPLWQTICRIATKLEGLPKEISMHCGGLVITPRPVSCYAPLGLSSDGYPLLAWEKEGTEMASFVKIDLLGNRSLAVIRDTLANLEEEDIHIDQRLWHPTEDEPTIAALAKGDSMGVFYIESPAMRQLQKKTGRGDFEHIVIHSSIIRPAANAFIAEYVERLRGKRWEPLHPRLAYILDETYGILCYQEDVSKTAVALAGFSESDADKLRKVIAKKAGGEKLRVYRQQFFDGCSANNVSEETTQKIWEMMQSFDGYSFCKPHSASYAMVSFQSAYLRVHHRAHFMAAVLSNQGGYYRSQAYISEARRMGIHIEGPDLNLSRIAYHARGNTLFIGLMAIANLTMQARVQIVEERKRRGAFSDLKDASSRLNLSREDWVSLVESGCCDSLALQYRRSEQLRILLTNSAREPESDQLELFTRPKQAAVQERALVQVKRTEDELHREFSALGFLRNSHPLLLWAQYLRGLTRVKASELGRYKGRYVNLIGYQITQKQVMTKGGQSMSFVSFEDETALYETVLFPDLYQRFHPLLSSLWPLVVFGLVQDDQGALVVEVQHLKKVGS